ncbi:MULTISPECIES: LLM class flavin-dependent oxidoreductase [Olivibacter]|jgi:probable LLM family oxidoreductase|uniref:LLM class flavin-dependent oxidoreductase n=2 Tax=Olivibacter TaxID=376469 RepID=A0ABV6HNX5_9SPHI|nr:MULTISPECIES: LLM class flavin-dependent oxidoreductase [Olivibacter]MCL4641841.1 LLM class flavin-dependent oxidoreductase [Olivibacter sp. UJ_SKK_5.1]MDM8173369.1 LLM class flavin-dependent oxidoreductase [Olivibacter sp. 47]MDX3915196.1 LLM class flavin-dependent oxidoreductase [Pseudosphingobacterium sp.]QEL03142.1 LLM class flavin-dependent oxidoreductase [Olivibacter sp. LS-1]
MELGLSMFGDLSYNHDTKTFQSAQERIKEILEEIKLADEVGLDVFGIGEHHRPDFAVSSPEIILAAAAGMTKQIKLTSSVTVLSSTDPVRTYQNFSSVDLISNGRAEITVGRGSFTESFPLFGYNLGDYNGLFAEKLDLLLAINKNEVITWKGRFRAPLEEQQVLPRATGKGLDIWVAVGGTPQSVMRAGRLGLPLIIAIIGGMPIQFKPFFELYKQEYIKAGHDPAKMRIATHSHGLIGTHGQELADRYFPLYAEQMNRIGKDRGWAPYTKEQFEGGRSRDGALFIGDVNQVVDKILYHQELFGLTRFLLHADVGAPPHKELMTTIELLGTKVAPAVRKALGK